MQIRLPPEVEELRSSVRRFAESELEPFAEEIDNSGKIPDALWDKLREAGYLGVRLPESYGGTGLDLLSYCIVVEELGRIHRVLTLMVEATNGLGPNAILKNGTDEQRETYVRAIGEGRLRTAFALTEPDAGSDAAGIKTRAEKSAGGWRLNGRKHYISGAHVADLLCVIAVTDPEKRARGGVTAFLVPRETKGLTVSRIDTTIGSEALKLAELTFDDCEVPEEAVLGEVGGGFKIAMQTLGEGRLITGCACIGMADRLLAMMCEHARTRHTFGKPLAERQAIQWMIADSAVEMTAARGLAYESARQIVDGEPQGDGPSMAKLYASEMVGRVADRAVQVFGGQGLIRGFPVERFYRDVRHYRIGEGSSEMQRMLISRACLKA